MNRRCEERKQGILCWIPNKFIRPLVLLCLIGLGEIIWLSIRVDLDPLSRKPNGWAQLVSHANVFVSVILASFAAGWFFGWRRIRQKPGEEHKLRGIPYKVEVLTFLQLSAFAVFSWLTVKVAEGNFNSSRFAGMWMLGWGTAGLSVGVLWLWAAIPLRAWLSLIRQGWSVGLIALMVGTAAWVLGWLANLTWESLRQPTFWSVHWLLQAFVDDVVSSPAGCVLGTKQFHVGISSACSGYQGMGLVVAFLTAYLGLFRKTLRFPRAFILFPAGVLAVWIANVFRIAFLVIIGTHLSPEIALGGFHSQVGWMGFIAVALAMMALSQRMPFFSLKEYSPAIGARGANPTTSYLGPLMALLATSMVSGMFSSGFDWLYPGRVLGTGVTIWWFWGRKGCTGCCHRSTIIDAAVRTLRPASSFWSTEAVGIGVAVFFLWMGLEWAMGNKGPTASIPNALAAAGPAWAAVWLIFRVIGSVVTVPIAEELAFRGYLLRRLVASDFEKLSQPRFTWLSFLLSSILFGALHGRWLAGIVAGMFYAWALYRRGRVGDPILAHAVTNALIAATVLIFNQYSLW